MASARTFKAGPRALLAGDGGLLAAAAFAVVVGLLALLMDAFDGSGPVGVLVVAVLLFAPLLAWWLHGHHVDVTATLGAILGFIAGAIVAFLAVAGISGLLGLSQGHLSWASVAAVVAVSLAVAVWLDVDALRDLSPHLRTHVRLDVLRLLATVAYVAFVVGWIVWARGLTPEQDRVRALTLLYEPGAIGAAAVMGADLLVRRHERRGHRHLVSGA